MSLRLALIWICLVAGFSLAPATAAQIEKDLTAQARVFPEVGAGLRAIQKDAAGRYYILTAPNPSVLIFDAKGARISRIPAVINPKSRAEKPIALAYGVGLSLDSTGRVYVADRGANAIKVYQPDGGLLLKLDIAAPISVAALGADEFAVTSMGSTYLVTVYDLHGKVVREFGVPVDFAERAELNRFVNIGRVASDPASNIYYSFDFLPEPTVRKYDRYGYAAFEISLDTLDFAPEAEATRREIHRQEEGGTPALKPVLTAIGVDPANQEIWLAARGILMHFDHDGNRVATYRTYTPEGARLEISAILVEPDRLLLACDPLGVFAFARPDKRSP